jgi:hypothetical protein
MTDTYNPQRFIEAQDQAYESVLRELKRRRDDFDFEPVEKIIHEFEKSKRVKIDNIDIGNIHICFFFMSRH